MFDSPSHPCAGETSTFPGDPSSLITNFLKSISSWLVSLSTRSLSTPLLFGSRGLERRSRWDNNFLTVDWRGMGEESFPIQLPTLEHTCPRYDKSVSFTWQSASSLLTVSSWTVRSHTSQSEQKSALGDRSNKNKDRQGMVLLKISEKLLNIKNRKYHKF